jgi:hypothetical protein
MLDSVDDYLGPAATRFFGAGYRRVDYRYGDVVAEAFDDVAGKLETTVGLSYPADWSKKTEGVTLRPHLSTVDGLILAIELSEACLAHACRLSPGQRSRLWVSGVRIKAGAEPNEELGTLDATTRILATKPDSTVVLETTIGKMRMRCEIAGLDDPTRMSAATYATPSELLGPAAGRYYGDGFKTRSHRVSGVVVTPATLTSEATVEYEEESSLPVGTKGIGGDYHPSPTTVDCFVTALQLGQVLLYELDSLSRSTSNTLWMRSTSLRAERPRRGVLDRSKLTTSLENTTLFEMGGSTWRTADIVAHLGGVDLRCAVTHRISRH